MKRYGSLILIAAAGCSPQYTSGKTQCSTEKQCPGGYSCKDDGTSATHYCFENGVTGTGGIRDAGHDGPGVIVGTGGRTLTGGATGRGGATGAGGIIGTGGATTGSTLCSGTPYSCSLQTFAGDCATENGCKWDGSTCSGTPSSCNTYSTSTWCLYNGCTWYGTLTCNATATTPTCTNLLVPTTDAGVDTCTVCDYTSCCGQYTACKNDSTCWTNGTGPLWNAWVDCYENCCATTC